MFDSLSGLDTTALGTLVTSFAAIPLVIPVALVSTAVGVVVIGVKGIQRLLGRRR